GRMSASISSTTSASATRSRSSAGSGTAITRIPAARAPAVALGPEAGLWVAEITYIPTWAGFLLPGRGARRMEPAGRGVGDDDAFAHRASARRAQHGGHASPSHQRDPPLGYPPGP